MTIAGAELLHLRLFIEGVEVPIIGAITSGGEGRPAACQIEVLPTPTAMRLKPRTRVDVFYLATGEGVATDVTYSTLKQSVSGGKGVPDSSYEQFFSGELFSMTLAKAGAGSRSLVLQCLDYSNNWDTSFLNQVKYGNAEDPDSNAVAGDRRAFLGIFDGITEFSNLLNSPELVIRDMAVRHPALYNVKGAMGGLFGFLGLIGGLPGKHVGVTAWHTIQEARTRLLDQIASDSGETSKQLFDNQIFEKFITNQIASSGGVVSVRELIDMVLSNIFYTVAPNPCGRLIEGTRETPKNWPASLTLSQGAAAPAPQWVEIKTQIEAILSQKWNGTGNEWSAQWAENSTVRTLQQYRTFEGASFTESQAKRRAHFWGAATDYNIDFSGEVGVGFNPSNKAADSKDEASNLHIKCLTIIRDEGVASKEQLFSFLTAAEQRTLTAHAEFYKDLGAAADQVSGARWGGATTFSPRSDPMWKLLGINSYDPVHVELVNWKTVLGVDINASSAALSSELDEFYAQLGPRERLINQVFKPTSWYMAPPACNIVFPEEVTNFTFNRQMMQETTRFELTTFMALAQSKVLERTFYAPTIEQVDSLTAGGLGEAAKALVYAHEKYSGIIPKMERMSEVAFFSKASPGQTIDKDGKLTTAGTDEESAVNEMDRLARRAAAFSFLSHRYAARTASITCRFLPRLVLGFPAAVLDRTAPEGDPIEGASNPFTPMHIIGNVTSLSHAVTQGGGTTTISLSHARSHKQGSELDDLFAQSVYEKGGFLSQQVQPAGKQYTITIGEKTLSKKEFDFCRRLSDLMSSPDFDETNPGLRGIYGYPIEGMSIVRVPFVVNEGVYGTTTDGSEAYEFWFSSVSVYEDTPATITPLEDAIRPPWVSDEFSNEKIGDVYENFYGCGSIFNIEELNVQPGKQVIDKKEFVESHASVSTAVEAIAKEYSARSSGGFLAAGWIKEKTRRSHATLPQVQAFFSESSGNLKGLQGDRFSWMKDGAVTSQLRPEEAQSLSDQLDPRAGRYEAAVKYQAELLRSQGLRG